MMVPAVKFPIFLCVRSLGVLVLILVLIWNVHYRGGLALFSDNKALLFNMESTKETAAPEGPILCINNCGFFGSAATMNMCSKCHREMILKQENAKLAASSFDDIINGGGSGSDVGKDAMAADVIKGVTIQPAAPVELNVVPLQACSDDSSSSQVPEVKVGPNRCSTCRKRVGLTGFNCKCGNLFCSAHRYSDKHECPFDYRGAGRDAIAKANPVVKAEKLDKI